MAKALSQDIGAGGILSVVAPHSASTTGRMAFCYGGTFFTLDGVMKAHCIAICPPSDAYQDSIEDPVATASATTEAIGHAVSP